MNVDTVPRKIPEDFDAKKATQKLEKNAEKKWYNWKY